MTFNKFRQFPDHPYMTPLYQQQSVYPLDRTNYPEYIVYIIGRPDKIGRPCRGSVRQRSIGGDNGSQVAIPQAGRVPHPSG